MNINFQSKLIFFSSILICLIPLALISGPFIPDLFLVIITINFLILISLNKEIYKFKNKFLFIFFAFCILISVVSTLSLNLISIKSSFFYFRFGLFSLAIYFFLNKNEKIFTYLTYFLIIIYLLLFLDTLYQYNFGKNLIGLEYKNFNNFRITSFFGKDEILGSYTVRILPVLIFLIIYKYEKLSLKKIFLFNSIILVSLVIVVFSGERTSLMLYILTLFFIFISSFNLRKILILPIILGIVILTTIIFSSEKVRQRMVFQTINQLGLTAKSERLILFSKVYEGHYLISLKMFKEKPIFGHGAKMFRFYCIKKENFVSQNACTTHPHNFYAQTLAETGISGFAFIISIYFFILFLFFKNFYFQIKYKKQHISDIGICLLSSLFVNLFPILPSGNFFNNWLSIIMYFPIGFLIYIIMNKKFYA